MKKMREKKDGSGASICSSPDNLVGVGRCNHLVSEHGDPSVSYDADQKAYQVNLNDYKMTNEDVKAANKGFKDNLLSLDTQSKKTLLKKIR